jgi:transposase
MGVSPSQLFNWRRQALAKETVTASLPGGGGVIAAAPRAVPVVEISMCGVVIRVAADIVEADLRRVLRAVRQS